MSPSTPQLATLACAKSLRCLFRLLNKTKRMPISKRCCVSRDAAASLFRVVACPLPVHAQAKIRPSKVIVVGTGVAGLAAIQQAKNMNALVRTQSEAQ